ncbi:PE-PPE domain-containing protein [Mycobacterium sp. ITM-2016-00317]|uniref:PE-PPE domain-containing protein n=1 Tax=Mycobacterium sp. ITM-2016-00317 TaxID=2099694 RepID=UPI00287FD025|nr:PE-PPE domain-containing protein [Mycobacterium sp. ITM-2016-00317]WNG87736.1 PE-PPE domain-containing protein [Mycobacterium sp. ITM-2016-00317]
MGRHSAPKKRIARSKLIAAMAAPAAVCLSWTPTAPAATVLGVEGTGQPKGTTQTAFNGAFCQQNTCKSINNNRTPFDVALGSAQIHNAVAATPGDVIVLAYSLGAASTYHRLRQWANNPAQAPDPDRVLVVTFGNPENRFGGDDRAMFWTGLPRVQPYEHLDVAMQYDSVADRPTRWGWFSSVNATFARHLSYFGDVDINDPDNLVYRDGNTTYMLIKADVLPMLKWMDWFVGDAVMAGLDRFFRPLVEMDYRRPAFIAQGEGADWGNENPPPSLEPAARGLVENETAAQAARDADGADQDEPGLPDTPQPADADDVLLSEPEALPRDEIVEDDENDPDVVPDEDPDLDADLDADLDLDEEPETEPVTEPEPQTEPETEPADTDTAQDSDPGSADSL